MTVAVCITTRNRRVELERTLAQLARLVPAPDEIFIVADGCTDGTATLVRAACPQARLIEHATGAGSVASRDEMARATACDILLSLDDDSYPIEQDAIAQIGALFEKNDRLAVAEFPQRTDERPQSLCQTDFGPAQFVGFYANSGAAIRRSAFVEVGGYFAPFFHMYEEPDFALCCVAAGWQVRRELCVTIRHHWTAAERSEQRNHHRHARNELWSALLRCPLPWLALVASFRIARQFYYATTRGLDWVLHEPVWWWQCLRGLGPCVKHRAPLPWRTYRAWMQLIRAPHDDAAKWERDFHQPSLLNHHP